MSYLDEVYLYYLRRLDGLFSAELLTLTEIAAFLGISKRTAKELFIIEGKYTSKANFARKLVNLGDRDVYNEADIPLESDVFENTLQRIEMAFPGRELLTIQDICNYLSLKRQIVATLDCYGYPGKYISKVKFARRLAQITLLNEKTHLKQKKERE